MWLMGTILAYGQSSSKDYIRIGGRVIAIENQLLSITTGINLPSATDTVAYGPISLVAGGGVAPYNWTLNTGSSLPPGLILFPKRINLGNSQRQRRQLLANGHRFQHTNTP